MRILFSFLIIGILASAWAANEYLGGLAEDKSGKIQREFTVKVSSLEPDALAGKAGAQFKLARLYETATPIVADLGLAAQWMERAALKGHIKAQYYYATMLEQGRGVSRNIKSAILWYQRASRNGEDADAQYALGRLYAAGIGVGNDVIQSSDWYQRAALGGNPAA
ncbi:MAG: sel1 repeat family protein, partial [Rhodospirillales bacterium]|nr:sel1 repeat family protein [Rhodospirillales bacterium]